MAVTANRAARRSAQKKLANNTLWDDVNELAKQCQLLLEKPLQLKLVMTDDIIANLENEEDVAEKINFINRDTANLSERLQKLRVDHANRKGAALGHDDYTFALLCTENYIQFMELYESTVTPVIYRVLEATSEAEKKLARIRAEQVIAAQTAAPAAPAA